MAREGVAATSHRDLLVQALQAKLPQEAPTPEAKPSDQPPASEPVEPAATGQPTVEEGGKGPEVTHSDLKPDATSDKDKGAETAGTREGQPVESETDPDDPNVEIVYVESDEYEPGTVLSEEEVEVPQDDDKPKREVWYEAEDGSVYLNPEEGKKALGEKAKYINDLKGQLEQKAAEIEEIRQSLQFYQQFTSQDQLQEMIVQSYMPEEFRGVTEDEISDEQQLKAFWKARNEAETRLANELAEAQKAEKERAEKAAEKRKAAVEYLKNQTGDKFFGVKNPEDKNRLAKMLNEKHGEYTTLQIAQFIHEAFGEEAAKLLMRGVKSNLWEGINHQVAKKIKKVVVKPRQKPLEAEPQAERPKDKRAALSQLLQEQYRKQAR